MQQRTRTGQRANEAPRAREDVAATTDIRIPKAAEVVADHLRNRIVKGHLPAGSTLAPEAELMRQFGISRPTLREAIRILESERLLHISRGGRVGALVLKPSADVAANHFGVVLQAQGITVADVYRARQLIEPGAARIVAETASDTAPAVLGECIEHNRACLHDNRRFGAASGAFYSTLIQLTRIETLVLIGHLLDNVLSRYTAQVWQLAESEPDHAQSKRRAIRAKERLTALIAAGDGPGAEAYMRLHTQTVLKLLEKWRLAGRVVDLLGTE